VCVAATVLWSKDDKPVKQTKFCNTQSNKTTHTLNITEALPEDEGIYKCTVSNPAGTTNTYAALKIICKFIFNFVFLKEKTFEFVIF
jgi:hypothetical protein